jgi:hypothetical protein
LHVSTVKTGRLTYRVGAGNFKLFDNSGHNQGVEGDVQALCDFLK